MKKLTYIISWLAIVMAMIMMMILSFWEFYPYKIIEFKKRPFPIVNEQPVARGDIVAYKIDACKFTDVVPEMTVFFVDGIVYEVPIKKKGGIGRGCAVTIIFIEVPKSLPVGTYSLKLIMHYKMNPFRTIEIINTTEKFVVK